MSAFELIRKNAIAVHQTGQTPLFTEAEFGDALVEGAHQIALHLGKSAPDVVADAMNGKGDPGLVAIAKALYPARIAEAQREKAEFERRFARYYL